MIEYAKKALFEEIEMIRESIGCVKDDILDPRFSFKSIEENKMHLKKLEQELKEKEKELNKLQFQVIQK